MDRRTFARRMAATALAAVAGRAPVVDAEPLSKGPEFGLVGDAVDGVSRSAV
jgi:hypothetical protein